MTDQAPSNLVERWGCFELALPGPSDGNPFVDVQLQAEFTHQHRTLRVDGFYDGAGVYRVRFMPDELGQWRYVTHSNASTLDGLAGQFACTAPGAGNHGPVRVHNTFHFAYADGRPYMQIGTTCYAWAHQGDALEVQTLATLRAAPFNKVRMCVFPKDYTYNKNEPVYYPFERTPGGDWDFARPSPAFFQHFEQRVLQLMELGIEADLILFHPYDRWGFARMRAEQDDRYLRYVVARLAAYRNVWWSLANEYDLMNDKSLADWDRFFRIIQTHDPYQHLRSIHNWQGLDTTDCKTFYDHGQPWVTHCSIQHAHVHLVNLWREQYRKPVIVDECCYEGNVPNGWGNITPQEMVRRFWEATVRGGYCGHGETYLDPHDVLWWSKGGVLKGQSPARLAFLRKILEEIPGGWIDPLGRQSNTNLPSGGQPNKFYLTYLGIRQPGEATFYLPDEGDYHADILDTWNMTVTPVEGLRHGHCTIQLPGQPYLAVRFQHRDAK